MKTGFYCIKLYPDLSPGDSTVSDGPWIAPGSLLCSTVTKWSAQFTARLSKAVNWADHFVTVEHNNPSGGTLHRLSKNIWYTPRKSHKRKRPTCFIKILKCLLFGWPLLTVTGWVSDEWTDCLVCCEAIQQTNRFLPCCVGCWWFENNLTTSSHTQAGTVSRSLVVTVEVVTVTRILDFKTYLESRNNNFNFSCPFNISY